MLNYYYLGGRITKAFYDFAVSSDLPFKNTLFVKDDSVVEHGVCSVCGCTMYDPCEHPIYGACSWADDDETLCSWCAKGVLNRSERNVVMHRVNTVNRILEDESSLPGASSPLSNIE